MKKTKGISVVGLIVIFFASVFTRFHLINTYALTVPYPDQWYVDICSVIYPSVHHTLHWQNFFTKWQEHRLVFTKFYDFALFKTLGRFDNIFQCKLSAVGISLATCFLFFKLGQKNPKQWWVFLIVNALILLLPIGRENTIMGVQSKMYFYIVALIMSAWFFASKRFVLGCLVSILGMFTCASGFITSMAMIGLLVVEQKYEWKRILTLLGIWFVGVLNVHNFSAQQQPHYAFSFWNFVMAFVHNLSWPCLLTPWAVVFVLPLLCVLTFHRGETSFNKRFAILLFFVHIINCAVIAVARANMGTSMMESYNDGYCLVLIAGVLAIIVLLDTKYVQALSVSWTCATIFGLVALLGKTLEDNSYWLSSNQQILAANALHYVAENHKEYKNAANDAPWGAMDNPSTPMPQLSSFYKDKQLMQVIPALWRIDHK